MKSGKAGNEEEGTAEGGETLGPSDTVLGLESSHMSEFSVRLANKSHFS